MELRGKAITGVD